MDFESIGKVGSFPKMTQRPLDQLDRRCIVGEVGLRRQSHVSRGCVQHPQIRVVRLIVGSCQQAHAVQRFAVSGLKAANPEGVVWLGIGSRLSCGGNLNRENRFSCRDEIFCEHGEIPPSISSYRRVDEKLNTIPQKMKTINALMLGRNNMAQFLFLERRVSGTPPNHRRSAAPVRSKKYRENRHVIEAQQHRVFGRR
jgi:hypothetical protein